MTVFDPKGRKKSCCDLESGDMTPEESALGFPQNTLAIHTEARAVKTIPLSPGETMVIEGQYPPCPSCKGKLNAAATASQSEIHYKWPDNGNEKTWITTKSSKNRRR